MTTKKRLAAYGMAATAAIGGGIGGLAMGLGLTSGAEPATVPTELVAASTGMPAHLGGAKVDRLGISAQALGMTAEELRTALQSGKTIAQVAADRNVDVQKVIDALVAAQTAAIDQAVKDGTLTQAQADERKAGLAARIKAEVDRVGPGGGHRGGPGGPGGVAKVDDTAIAAQALGMPVEEMRTALQGGKSIAQVAADRNVDVQKVIDAITAADTAAIDQAVTDGKLTQAQADERKAGLAAHVKAEVERVGLRGPGGPGGHRGPGGPDGAAKVDRLGISAQALGMTAEELRTALQSGKTIAQVAADRNVDVQKVVDALVAAQTAAIDQAVKDGTLTQAQADERKAGLAARVKAEVERVGLRGPGDPGGHGKGGRGPGGPGAMPAPGTAATPSGVVTN